MDEVNCVHRYINYRLARGFGTVLKQGGLTINNNGLQNLSNIF